MNNTRELTISIFPNEGTGKTFMRFPSVESGIPFILKLLEYCDTVSLVVSISREKEGDNV